MIYKYRSFNSMHKFDPFLQSQLYFASPRDFNDPFESRPRLVGIDTLEERKGVVNSFLKRRFGRLGFKKREKIRREGMIRLLDPGKMHHDMHNLLGKYGIFCASKNWDQCLMWSHYSDCHKGFCIGFEFDAVYDFEVGLPKEVVYSTDYPTIDAKIFEDQSEERNIELLTSTLGTKSFDWKYEEEVRYIKLPKDGGHGVYKFSREKIREVIIGACVEASNKTELIRIVKSMLPWVNIYQLSLSNSKYELMREMVG